MTPCGEKSLPGLAAACTPRWGLCERASPITIGLWRDGTNMRWGSWSRALAGLQDAAARHSTRLARCMSGAVGCVWGGGVGGVPTKDAHQPGGAVRG